MGNIITILRQIFTGTDDESLRVGISEFKIKNETPKRFKQTVKKCAPQELRLSELMRRAY